MAGRVLSGWDNPPGFADNMFRGEFMASAWQVLVGYPTAVFSALLLVVLIYWGLALIGLVDFESAGDGLGPEIGHEAQLEGDSTDIGVLASYLVALGLNGVPFSIVVSLLVFFGWVLTATFSQLILPWVPTALLTFVIGTAGLLLACALSILLTARVVRPMRKLFVTHTAVSNAAIVGQNCRVLTGHVDEQFGRAEVATNGAAINIRVWAQSPNTLRKGSLARIVEYEAEAGRYRIESEV